MNTFFALVLVFTTTDKVNISANVLVFPTEAACEAQLTYSLAYQRGVHETDNWNVNGFCREVKIVGGKST
jgi:hypothetical protein